MRVINGGQGKSPDQARAAGAGAEIEPPEEWQVQSSCGLLRRDGTPQGRLVLLADLVRWLMRREELPVSLAVNRVCTPLESECPPAVYSISESDFARTMDDAGGFALFNLTDEERRLPPAVAWARRIARRLREEWLKEPRKISFLTGRQESPVGMKEQMSRARSDAYWASFAHDPAMDAAQQQRLESFEISIAKDAFAVDFASAHAVWGWGSPKVVASAHVGPISTVEEFKASRATMPKRARWTEEQTRFLRIELVVRKVWIKRPKERWTLDSKKLGQLAREMGLSGRQALDAHTGDKPLDAAELAHALQYKALASGK